MCSHKVCLGDDSPFQVRPTTFHAAEKRDTSCPIEFISETELEALDFWKSKIQWNGEETAQSERPDLSSARIVVSGGRALQSKEQFQLVEDLAKQLGAAVGATRAAVDAGFAQNDCQVS